MSNFKQQVAAITGAGSGMGRALAQALAQQGCHLAIADINQKGLSETVSSITDQAGDVSPVKLTTHIVDVADRQAMVQFAADVVEEHGKVNMIFNNAGVTVIDSVEHMSDENFEWLMGINFWGVVNGTRAFLPHLSQTEPCHIVNTSSIFGSIAVPGQSAYNASKFAVRGFTYALRMELAETHPLLGVSCVQPGGVKTNIVKDSRYLPSDNSAPTKEEVSAKFESLAGLTSSQAANQILRGVKKNKAQILVGKDAWLMALLERIVPIGYMRLIAKGFSQQTASVKS